jgi:hypothetical protein
MKYIFKRPQFYPVSLTRSANAKGASLSDKKEERQIQIQIRCHFKASAKSIRSFIHISLRDFCYDDLRPAPSIPSAG